MAVPHPVSGMGDVGEGPPACGVLLTSSGSAVVLGFLVGFWFFLPACSG